MCLAAEYLFPAPEGTGIQSKPFFAPLDTRKKGQQNPIEYVYKIV